MLFAKDIMQKNIRTIREEALVGDAIKALVEYKISALPVIDSKGQLCGIISEKDILKIFSGNKSITKVQIKEVCSRKIYVFGPDDLVVDIAQILIEKKIKRVPIIGGDNHLQGIVSRRDILRFILKVRVETERTF